MTEVITHNRARIRVERDGTALAPITLTIGRASTTAGDMRAYMTIDEASMVAACLSNAVDAAKRGDK